MQAQRQLIYSFTVTHAALKGFNSCLWLHRWPGPLGLKPLQHQLTRDFLRSDWQLVSLCAAAWPVPFSGRSPPESTAWRYENITNHNARLWTALGKITTGQKGDTTAGYSAFSALYYRLTESWFIGQSLIYNCVMCSAKVMSAK